MAHLRNAILSLVTFFEQAKQHVAHQLGTQEHWSSSSFHGGAQVSYPYQDQEL
jgi:hypothetical protein